MPSGAASRPALMVVNVAPIHARRFQNFGVSDARRFSSVFILLYGYSPALQGALLFDYCFHFTRLLVVPNESMC